jgi:hypothetical protein
VHTGSGGSTSPSSDTEFSFSLSDGGENARRSGSLSSKPSLGSLRAAVNGAIGSERKERDWSSRTRGSTDSLRTAASASGDEGSLMGAGYGSEPVNQASERRKMPMFVLSSAEKRKSPIL